MDDLDLDQEQGYRRGLNMPAAAALVLAAAMGAVALVLAQSAPLKSPWVVVNIPPAGPGGPPAAENLAPPEPPKPAPVAQAPAAPAKPALPDGALTPAPDPELIENVAGVDLPIIGKDGRKPWQVYARPFTDRTVRPRIAIIIGGLGLRQATSSEAIDHLPRNVTLAFTPYARDLPEWAARTRLAGHEFMIQVPMEPLDFPTSDPGPKALMVQNPPSENLARLDWTMSRAPGYIGLVTYLGSRFTAESTVVRPFIDEMKTRGLMVVDSGSADKSVVPPLAADANVANAAVTRLIDGAPTRAAIDARLAELERYAASNGYAIGLGSDYPSTIEQVQAWALGLEARGFVLAPVSALAGVTNGTVSPPDNGNSLPPNPSMAAPPGSAPLSPSAPEAHQDAAGHSPPAH